jgi:alcohol dehydrogenase class IV
LGLGNEAEAVVDFCRKLGRFLHVPGLQTWGLKAELIPIAVERGMAASSMKGNPIALTDAELAGILEQAL